MMANKVQIRRGLRTSLPALTPGEFGLCTDTSELFIGSPVGNIRVATDTDVDSLKENTWNKSNFLVESGTWTPILQSYTPGFAYTYSEQSGKYTRQGNLVTISYRIVVSAHTATDGNVHLDGYPFPFKSGIHNYGSPIFAKGVKVANTMVVLRSQFFGKVLLSSPSMIADLNGIDLEQSFSLEGSLTYETI